MDQGIDLNCLGTMPHKTHVSNHAGTNRTYPCQWVQHTQRDTVDTHVYVECGTVKYIVRYIAQKGT